VGSGWQRQGSNPLRGGRRGRRGKGIAYNYRNERPYVTPKKQYKLFSAGTPGPHLRRFPKPYSRLGRGYSLPIPNPSMPGTMGIPVCEFPRIPRNIWSLKFRVGILPRLNKQVLPSPVG